MHPYKKFTANSFWDSSVTQNGWESVFSGFSPKFKISINNKISSAGSCFSQRVKKSLIENGLNYSYFEKPHDFHKLYADRDFGYDNFSCRYGNIYNSFQLQQLVDECLGYRDPIIKFGKNKKIDMSIFVVKMLALIILQLLKTLLLIEYIICIKLKKCSKV